MGKSRVVVNAERNLIRQHMNHNLELGKTHNDIIQQLGIPRTNYFRRVKEIMNEDSKIWDKVNMDSAKYRASQLVQRLEECINLCKQVRDNPNEDSRTRMEASQNMCIAEAQLFKIIESGPTFRISIPLVNNNKTPELTDQNNETI